MKRPAFQFYPADWRKDVELQSCSMAAQGLWINLMCIMHECEPYGHAALSGRAMTAAQIGRQVGLTASEAEALLSELLDAGVAKRDGEGPIYSKRMVSDERVRNARAEGGKSGAEHGIKGAEHGVKGGRPTTHKGGSETPLQDAKEPPPSSSSSSSSSSSLKDSLYSIENGTSKVVDAPRKRSADTRGTRLPDGWQLPKAWGEWAMADAGMSRESVRIEAEKFADYWHGIAGAKARKADWQATWRNWCRNAQTSLKTPIKGLAESFRERDARLAAERVAEATGGLSVDRSALRKPLPFEAGYVADVIEGESNVRRIA